MEGRDYIRAACESYSKLNTFFYPRFSLVYFKLEGGIPIRHVTNLPARYILSGGRDVPVYAAPTTDVVYSIEMDAINRTMQEVSSGDPDKKNYVILTVLVDVLTLDMNLSGYYSSGKISNDGFSVKLDQTDFTNVEGGLGIFGSYVNAKFTIRLNKDYIKSFGYKTKLGEE